MRLHLKGIRILTWLIACLFFYNSTSAIGFSNSHINKQIQELQQTLKQDQQQQIDLLQQLKVAEIAISQLSQQISSLNTLLHGEQIQINTLKKEQALAHQKLSEQRSALALQLGAAYQLGQAQTLKIILNHKDPTTLARHLTYYHYLSEARIELISDMRSTLMQLNNNVYAINQHQQNLKNLLEEKQSQQTKELETQQQRQKLISALSVSMQNKQQQINSLLANQKALHQLVNKLQIHTENITQPFSSLRLKLKWPVKGRVVTHFGSLLDVGNQRLNGVVIKAEEGTPVRAIHSGKVIFSNWLRGFGMLVILNHDDNFMSLYARNHSISVKVGDTVNTGDVIATTGSSGGFNNAGLYFEIRQNGMPLNPSKWCR